MDLLELEHAYTAALRVGDEQTAGQVVAAAQAADIDPLTIYLRIFAPSMVTIGRLWEQNQLTVAEEHLATAITERLIGQLSAQAAEPTTMNGECGRAVLGCVAGERHVLGLRMLSDMFRHAGWQVLYLGADVPTTDWARLSQRFQPDLAVIAVTTGRFLPEVRSLITLLRVAAPRVLILVGGAAFDQAPEAWRSLGADMYHADPQAAVVEATARYLARNPFVSG